MEKCCEVYFGVNEDDVEIMRDEYGMLNFNHSFFDDTKGGMVHMEGVVLLGGGKLIKEECRGKSDCRVEYLKEQYVKELSVEGYEAMKEHEKGQPLRNFSFMTEGYLKNVLMDEKITSVHNFSNEVEQNTKVLEVRADIDKELEREVLEFLHYKYNDDFTTEFLECCVAERKLHFLEDVDEKIKEYKDASIFKKIFLRFHGVSDKREEYAFNYIDTHKSKDGVDETEIEEDIKFLREEIDGLNKSGLLSDKDMSIIFGIEAEMRSNQVNIVPKAVHDIDIK